MADDYHNMYDKTTVTLCCHPYALRFVTLTVLTLIAKSLRQGWKCICLGQLFVYEWQVRLLTLNSCYYLLPRAFSYRLHHAKNQHIKFAAAYRPRQNSRPHRYIIFCLELDFNSVLITKRPTHHTLPCPINFICTYCNSPAKRKPLPFLHWTINLQLLPVTFEFAIRRGIADDEFWCYGNMW